MLKASNIWGICELGGRQDGAAFFQFTVVLEIDLIKVLCDHSESYRCISRIIFNFIQGISRRKRFGGEALFAPGFHEILNFGLFCHSCL